MNIFSEAKDYPIDLSRKTLCTLEKSLIKDIVLFLDIDDTLGNSYSKSTRILDNPTEIKEKVVLIKHLEFNTFMCVFNYIQLVDDKEIVIEMSLKFKFKNFIRDFFSFLKKNEFNQVCLFSAASKIYIECIRKIIEDFYELPINNIISAADKPIKTYQLEISEGFQMSDIYIPKDMFEALVNLGLSDKIPLLIDDRGFWAANGFVISINPGFDNIYEYIDKPIQKSKGVMI